MLLEKFDEGCLKACEQNLEGREGLKRWRSLIKRGGDFVDYLKINSPSFSINLSHFL